MNFRVALVALVLGVSPVVVLAADVSIDPPAGPVALRGTAIKANLTVTPTSVAAGQDLAYTLTVENTGTETLPDLAATFDLPVGFVFASGTGVSTTLKLGPLAVGATKSSTFNLTVTADAPTGRVPLEVLISADNLDPTEVTETVTVRAGAVQGAETLVETGVSLIPLWLVGLAAIMAGVIYRLQQRVSYQKCCS